MNNFPPYQNETGVILATLRKGSEEYERIVELVKNLPNDADLGKAIRKRIMDKLNED